MNERNLDLRDDDWIERVLRDDARGHAQDYLPDDGFTARVMHELPPPATLPAWRKSAVALLWTVAGAAAIAVFPDAFGDVTREVYRLFAQPLSLPQVGAAIVALGAAMWSGAAWMLRED